MNKLYFFLLSICLVFPGGAEAESVVAWFGPMNISDIYIMDREVTPVRIGMDVLGGDFSPCVSMQTKDPSGAFGLRFSEGLTTLLAAKAQGMEIMMEMTCKSFFGMSLMYMNSDIKAVKVKK